MDHSTRAAAVWALGAAVLLGYFPPARALLKGAINNQVFPVGTVCLAIAGVGNSMQAFDFFSQSAVLILCIIVTGAICFAVSTQEKKNESYSEPPPEQLRRYPLIRGLMHAVMAGKSNRKECANLAELRINRIALTGPWGSGKSLILDHVAFALQKHKKARAIKVNPWSCETVDQARACLAEGLRRLLQSSADSPPAFFRTVSKALGYSDAVDAVFDYAGESREKSLERLDEKLGEEELRTNMRMILVIDDMERAEPHVVRGLLPILNELVELKHCTFLMAIDTDHFRRAFASPASNVFVHEAADLDSRLSGHNLYADQAQADGFLKKVIDFAIQMPVGAPPDRIQAMARINLGLAKPGDDLGQPHLDICPDFAYPKMDKLILCLPGLTPHLPSNPRDEQRFLARARLLELCFLSDYEEDEYDWGLFFHLWLMDTRFPGFARTFNVKLSGLHFAKQNELGPNTEEILKDLKQKGMSHLFGSEFSSALEGFVNHQDLMFCPWDWYAEEFLCPRTLPGKLRSKLLTTWGTNPSLRLPDLAHASYGGSESPDFVGLTKDLLDSWIAHFSKVLSRIFYYPGASKVEKSDLKKYLESIITSIEAWAATDEELGYIRSALTGKHLGGFSFESHISATELVLEEFGDLCERCVLKLISCLDAVHCDAVIRSRGFADRQHDAKFNTFIDEKCSEIIRSEVWDTLKSEKKHVLYEHVMDALLDHSKIFPIGSEERDQLLNELDNPGPNLSNGIKFAWSQIYEWLPRWNPDNGRDNFKTDPDLWLSLFLSMEKLVSTKTFDEISKRILGIKDLPEGLNLVRLNLRSRTVSE